MSVFVGTYTTVYVPWYKCGGPRTAFGRLFFPSSVGSNLGCQAWERAFTHQAILLTLFVMFWGTTIIFSAVVDWFTFPTTLCDSELLAPFPLLATSSPYYPSSSAAPFQLPHGDFSCPLSFCLCGDGDADYFLIRLLATFENSLPKPIAHLWCIIMWCCLVAFALKLSCASVLHSSPLLLPLKPALALSGSYFLTITIQVKLTCKLLNET